MPGLGDFKDKHRGKDIIVCGCGESLRDLKHPEQFITIGVNDVGRLFHPDYLVVVNPRRQFAGDRFRYVEQSQAKYLFTQLDLGIPHPNIVKFKLGTYGGTNGSDPNVLHYTQNSPYVAVCLAAHMGARRIGIIGVDFTDNHFFGKTGRHALANQLPQINEQYRKLRETLNQRGIEVFNLSARSRLEAFDRMSADAFGEGCDMSNSAKRQIEPDRSPRIFFVHYRFLSCGDVFKLGLEHASADLGLAHTGAYWDDPRLPEKVNLFRPDLLFVVHGRNFIKRWSRAFPSIKKAVWLLDEPYEVDDTARWSGEFDTVFVNDPATLARHRNAHYLPVCYDPKIHRNGVHDRKYNVGFIGGHNETRERSLAALAREGVLSYVVGGPWRDPLLQRICKGRNVPPAVTAELYRQTKIVVNVFREIHHYNREKIAGRSMNPRIYEAAACGALVISEPRPEITSVFPEMPVIGDQAGLVSAVRDFLNENEKYQSALIACSSRLHGHTYSDRLKKIMLIACAGPSINEQTKEFSMRPPIPEANNVHGRTAKEVAGLEEWEDFGGVLTVRPDGSYILEKDHDSGPGTEKGLISRKPLESVNLDFEIYLDENACFIAKIQQAGKLDQLTNSYHLMCSQHGDYFARHNHIFKTFRLNRNSWEKISITARHGLISMSCNGTNVFSVRDHILTDGYAFLGCKGGQTLLRNISIRACPGDTEKRTRSDVFNSTDFEVLHERQRPDAPVVSIITTVYDRANCLEECVKSVKNLRFKQYEQIIVADSPPPNVVQVLHDAVLAGDEGKQSFVNLKRRHNNWGIAPAAIGLHLARGKYVCFLSDDNGYKPEHFDNLVPILERQPEIGFVYSSCEYAGRLRLRNPLPRPGGIDLGQPLFRKNLFYEHLQGTLPFNEFGWDWRMIETFIKKDVKWRHVDHASFLFRLASCQRAGCV